MWFKYFLLFFGVGFIALKAKIWEWKKDDDIELAFRKKHYYILTTLIIYSVFAFLITIF